MNQALRIAAWTILFTIALTTVYCGVVQFQLRSQRFEDHAEIKEYARQLRDLSEMLDGIGDRRDFTESLPAMEQAFQRISVLNERVSRMPGHFSDFKDLGLPDVEPEFVDAVTGFGDASVGLVERTGMSKVELKQLVEFTQQQADVVAQPARGGAWLPKTMWKWRLPICLVFLASLFVVLGIPSVLRNAIRHARS